jgi:hypothetical protein
MSSAWPWPLRPQPSSPARSLRRLPLGTLLTRSSESMSGNTIGMYRGSWLAYPDKFGEGRNPSDGSSYRKGDFSFWYEVISNPVLGS